MAVSVSQDYVCLCSSSTNEYFLYESNFEYSLESIIEDFHTNYGIVLTSDYLNSCSYDAMGNLISGIIIRIVASTDYTWSFSYLVKYDGKAYVINK